MVFRSIILHQLITILTRICLWLMKVMIVPMWLETMLGTVDSFRYVKFCIKFLFCYLIISIPIVSGWLLIIYCFASCLVLLYFYSISKVYLSGLWTIWFPLDIIRQQNFLLQTSQQYGLSPRVDWAVQIRIWGLFSKVLETLEV